MAAFLSVELYAEKNINSHPERKQKHSGLGKGGIKITWYDGNSIRGQKERADQGETSWVMLDWTRNSHE